MHEIERDDVEGSEINMTYIWGMIVAMLTSMFTMGSNAVIDNIDATIIAQKPKLRPYLDQMAENIAGVLHLERDQVNIKATTEEGLGFTGNMEGIAAQAVCALSGALDGCGILDSRMGQTCRGCGGD